jgi:hypothetical protein
MRKPFAAIAISAAIFSLTLLSREGKNLLWLLSRITRRTLGRPAPLQCNMPPSQRIPDPYVVSLANSYSLEQHKQRTGRAVDLERTILDIGEVNDVLLGDITVYEAKSDDASLVNGIRADLGVLFIECKGRIHLRMHRVGSVQPTPLDQTVF